MLVKIRGDIINLKFADVFKQLPYYCEHEEHNERKLNLIHAKLLKKKCYRITLGNKTSLFLKSSFESRKLMFRLKNFI